MRWWVPALVAASDVQTAQLSRLEVLGKRDGDWKWVVLSPPFQGGLDQDAYRERTNVFFYEALLDFDVEEFCVTIEARVPAIISHLEQDGESIKPVEFLDSVRLGVGEQTVFQIDVYDLDTTRYQLKVMRSDGRSVGLREFEFLTGSLVDRNATDGSSTYDAEQAFPEDWAEIEWVKKDRGQKVTCELVDVKTVGPTPPTDLELKNKPEWFVPALEGMNKMIVSEGHHKARGVVGKCSVPLDTWREALVGLHIQSADSRNRRVILVNITRGGCRPLRFYYHGKCQRRCPTFFFEQDYNWRCGECANHCAECPQGWKSCAKCRDNTTEVMYTPSPEDPGTCVTHRIPQHGVGYSLVWYFCFTVAVCGLVYCGVCTIFSVAKFWTRKRRTVDWQPVDSGSDESSE
mmetsp:Transcript_10806/g.25878  ORF Transcript_10806/g.25878 Transcript_10806/m.25878 type:complete len:403 (-) Transcript_10806:22-1230(-)